MAGNRWFGLGGDSERTRRVVVRSGDVSSSVGDAGAGDEVPQDQITKDLPAFGGCPVDDLDEWRQVADALAINLRRQRSFEA